MPSLKEVRTRIASVNSTKQITSAMKMVAASKLRKAQTAILKLRPYAAKLKEILQNLSMSLEASQDGIYSRQRDVEKVLIIPIASNRGLCGAFNSNVIKMTNKLIHEKYSDQNKKGNVSLICIGKRPSEFYKKRNYNVVATYDHLFDNLTFEHVTPVAEMLMKNFADGKYDKIEIVYNQFKNAAVQLLITEQYLPVEPVEPSDDEISNTADYIFEPSKEEIINELVPKSLKLQLYKAILDSNTSEHGARMTAMHQATDNATELLKDLRLTYNKARQAAITKEILEIVSGAEALKN